MKKLFKIYVGYGQFVVVAESKEAAYKLFCPEGYNIEMEDIEEVEGYTVKGENSIIGGYAE